MKENLALTTRIPLYSETMSKNQMKNKDRKLKDLLNRKRTKKGKKKVKVVKVIYSGHL
jgi:hypothetical protein